MTNIIKSALYKLSKDWTFRITLIIGVVLAVLMNLIYLGIDSLMECIGATCNGQSFFISSLSPTQNFGLTVPINLIIFTIGEFNCGTIRNKIIAGHKRSSIYFSLLLIGLIFTISLMLVYFGLSVGISSIIGGFKTDGPVGILSGTFRKEYLYQYSLMALCTYVFIASLSIFVSVSIRHIGGTLPIVIIAIIILNFSALIPTVDELIGSLSGQATDLHYQAYLNPMFTFGQFSLGCPDITTKWFIVSLITPLYWSALLTLLGILIFKKSDVK